MLFLVIGIAARALSHGPAPGAAVLIVDHGHVVYSENYGVRDLASKAPVDDHTRFEIGSITKEMVAASILQLKEGGKLSLSDRLGKYFPQYTAGQNITLEQMLQQVSGIPNFGSAKGFDSRNPGTTAAVLELLDDLRLDFDPGSHWEYSNSNYYLLAAIVSQVSGMPWQQYVREHIFAPSGMNESSFAKDEGSIADMAIGYTQPGKKAGELVKSEPMNGWAGGAGDIVSTTRDVAKWDEALFSGKIVDAADLKLMTVPGPFPAMGGGYGFGWVIDSYHGFQRFWHPGQTNGFVAANMVYPTLGEDVIVLCNLSFVDSQKLGELIFNVWHSANAPR